MTPALDRTGHWFGVIGSSPADRIRVEAGRGRVRVAHVTTVHPAFDVRIFWKECRTLAAAGYDVTLVAPGDGSSSQEGVSFRYLKPRTKRLARAFLGNMEAFRVAMNVRAVIYHLHDPELFPCAVLLKISGRTVVMDIHEDVPAQILTKSWISPSLRGSVSKLARVWEWIIGRLADQVVVVIGDWVDRFGRGKATLVQNYPLTQEFPTPPDNYLQRASLVTYVGGVSIDRGLLQMVQAISLVPENLEAELKIAGTFSPPSLETDSHREAGWSRSQALGWASRAEVVELLNRTRIGLMVLQPTPNAIGSQPNKLFEYMAAALPVVASDFPRWREIIDGSSCGLLVDPTSPQLIADAIIYLLENPVEATAMGMRGREAILSTYNWTGEGQRLVALYDRLSVESGRGTER
jgi:glycosyltransferase involved in cell wall biosynthesis